MTSPKIKRKAIGIDMYGNVVFAKKSIRKYPQKINNNINKKIIDLYKRGITNGKPNEKYLHATEIAIRLSVPYPKVLKVLVKHGVRLKSNRVKVHSENYEK